MFDLSDLDSFISVSKWKKLCNNTTTHSSPTSSAPIYFLVGNKLDKNIRAIDVLQIQNYCDDNGIAEYFETSAYTGFGIKQLYDTLTHHITTNYIPHEDVNCLVSDKVYETETTSSYCQC